MKEHGSTGGRAFSLFCTAGTRRLYAIRRESESKGKSYDAAEFYAVHKSALVQTFAINCNRGVLSNLASFTHVYALIPKGSVWQDA